MGRALATVNVSYGSYSRKYFQWPYQLEGLVDLRVLSLDRAIEIFELTFFVWKSAQSKNYLCELFKTNYENEVPSLFE